MNCSHMLDHRKGYRNVKARLARHRSGLERTWMQRFADFFQFAAIQPNAVTFEAAIHDDARAKAEKFFVQNDIRAARTLADRVIIHHHSGIVFGSGDDWMLVDLFTIDLDQFVIVEPDAAATAGAGVQIHGADLESAQAMLAGRAFHWKSEQRIGWKVKLKISRSKF